MATMFETFFPILVLLLIALVLASVFTVLSIFLGRRTTQGKKCIPYECGIQTEGTTKDPVRIRYFMVAISFILFDIEVVFMYPWAVLYNKFNPVVFGFIEMVVFIVILLVGYIYVWRKGALDWR